MIRIMKYGEVANADIFARSVPEVDVTGIVSDIIADVRARGDAALLEYCAKFDKVRLDALNDDITVNGLTEWFQQSEKCEPYKRERPEAAMFVKLDKNYQSIMKQLADLVPPDAETPETVCDAFDCE